MGDGERFWRTFHKNCHEFAHEWNCPRTRLAITMYCKQHDWPETLTGLKFLSYFGAIRCKDRVAPHFTCPFTKVGYFDPTNEVYFQAFRKVWPGAVREMSKKTIGDLVEALLGFAWIQQNYYPRFWDYRPRRLVHCLEEVVFFMYWRDTSVD